MLPSSSFDLPVDKIQDFRSSGHIFLEGVYPGIDNSKYRDEILKIKEEFNLRQKELADRDTYGKAFLQMMNLWELNDTVKELTMARRFGEIAAKLLGVNAVRLYHDQALYKEPGGGHTPWHQDMYYWPLDTCKTVTMWMPLVDIEEGDDTGTS